MQGTLWGSFPYSRFLCLSTRGTSIQILRSTTVNELIIRKANAVHIPTHPLSSSGWDAPIRFRFAHVNTYAKFLRVTGKCPLLYLRSLWWWCRSSRNLPDPKGRYLHLQVQGEKFSPDPVNPHIPSSCLHFCTHISDVEQEGHGRRRTRKAIFTRIHSVLESRNLPAIILFGFYVVV